MLSEGKNPEDATRLFHLALERVQSKQYDDAEQYFGLSIDYELRPITFLELAKLRLLRDSPPVRALKDIEEGLKLCSDRNEHVQVRNELLSLKANFIEPLIAEREREY